MDELIENVLLENYKVHAKFAGREAVKTLIEYRDQPDTIETNSDDGLDFDLTIVLSVLNGAISVIEVIIEILKFKRETKDINSELTKSIQEELIKRMTKEELIEALATNSLDHLIKSVNQGLK